MSLSLAQLGGMISVIYISATCVSLPAGWIVDKFDNRLISAAIFAMAMANLVALSLAPSYWVLLLIALATGFACAGGNPVTNRLVVTHAPVVRRGMILGVKQSGVQAAASFAGLVLPPTALVVGWRTAVALAALVPLVGLILSLKILPPSTDELDDTPERADTTLSWRDGTLPYLMLYAFLMGGGIAAVMTHTALYLHKELAFDEASAGLVIAVLAVTGLVARLGWGWFSDRLERVALALLWLGVISVVASLLLLTAGPGAVWMVWVGAIGLGLSAGAWNAVGMLAILREVAKPNIGQASGLVAFGFFGGFIVSPTAFGLLVDASSTYAIGWLAVLVQFALASAVAFLWVWRQRGEADREG